MPNTNIVGPVQTVVAKVKELARTALRGQLISARLAKIAGLNGEVTTVNGYIADQNKEIARANYALSMVDAANPDAADLTKEANDRVTAANASIKKFQDDLANLQKSIDEQNAGIAAIESGATKVSAEELACLVDKMLVAQAKEAAAQL